MIKTTGSRCCYDEDIFIFSLNCQEVPATNLIIKCYNDNEYYSHFDDNRCYYHLFHGNNIYYDTMFDTAFGVYEIGNSESYIGRDVETSLKQFNYFNPLLDIESRKITVESIIVLEMKESNQMK